MSVDTASAVSRTTFWLREFPYVTSEPRCCRYRDVNRAGAYRGHSVPEPIGLDPPCRREPATGPPRSTGWVPADWGRSTTHGDDALQIPTTGVSGAETGTARGDSHGERRSGTLRGDDINMRPDGSDGVTTHASESRFWTSWRSSVGRHEWVCACSRCHGDRWVHRPVHSINLINIIADM